MDVIRKMNPEKFQNEITNKDILPIQIITLALNTGAISFLGVILFLYFTSIQSPDASYDTSSLNNIFYIMFIFFPISIVASRIVSRKVLLGELDTAHSSMDSRDSAEKKLFAVLLTNRVNPTRANTKIIQFRPKLHDEIVRSIMYQ